MFDIGFGELILIGIVALIVLGPERLPKAARFAGLWVRRARAQWDSVKQELERELAAEDLKRSLHDTTDSLRQAGEGLREAHDSMARNGQQAQSGLERMRRALQPGAAPVDAAPAPAADTPALPAPSSPQAATGGGQDSPETHATAPAPDPADATERH